MKNFYVILCSIALSTSTFIATAQTTSEEKKYLNDIGFNTTFLLNGVFNSGQTPFTLMYKKYKDNNNPLRFGVRLNLSLANINENGASDFSSQSNFYFSAVIGKEYQKLINRNWVWYFGGDIVPTFQYYNWEVSYTNNYNQKQTDKKVGLGFLPFLGVRYNINSRLYLSTEFSFGPTYTYNWNKLEEGDPTSIIRDTKGSIFNFSMNPAYGLFLYYRF